MKIAICDDEVNICSILREYLMEYGEENGLTLKVDTFYSGDVLLAEMRDGYNVELLFLDIVMDGLNGVEIGKAIREEMDNQNMKIVYISGSQGYERQLFDCQPMNFIEKPIEKEKVYKTLELAKKLLAMNIESFSYKSGHVVNRVRIADILYFESSRRKMILHTKEGKSEFYGTMNEIEEKLSCYRFVRVQRAFFVNYDYIVEINVNEVILSNGIRIKIGNNYKIELHRKMRQFER